MNRASDLIETTLPVGIDWVRYPVRMSSGVQPTPLCRARGALVHLLVEFLDAQDIVLPEDVDVEEGAEEEEEEKGAEKGGEHSHYSCLLDWRLLLEKVRNSQLIVIL